MTLRAALYCRVSTEEQAMEGYSIDAQKERLEAYCSFSTNEMGEDAYSVAKCYLDEGFSGKNANRPSYKQMMEELDQWDVLIVLKMDRIHRNSRNFMNMMDLLSRKGKQFVSATEDLDTSNAMGRFVMSMIQSIAQLESEQIGERTFMGMREKAETMSNSPGNNRTMGFSAPFGYALEDGNLEALPSELFEVSYMFGRCLEGASIDSIVNDLNHSNILTHRGKKWTKFNVSQILHNPIYAGYIRWQELTYRHFADTAVDVHEFNRAQQMMAARVRDPAKRNVVLLPEEGMPENGSVSHDEGVRT